MVANMKILVIDDEEEMRTILADAIRQSPLYGNKVGIDFAEDGKRALSFSDESKYDLIVTDYLMPNLNGIEYLEILRKPEAVNQHTPVICVSGYLPKIDADISEAILEKVFFLEKPYDDDKLDRLIKLALAARLIA